MLPDGFSELPYRLACMPLCHQACRQPFPLPVAAPISPSCTLQDQMPADVDARKSWQWNKAKKWVWHIASRLFNRCVCCAVCCAAP
jgi:hypothetical protein